MIVTNGQLTGGINPIRRIPSGLFSSPSSPVVSGGLPPSGNLPVFSPGAGVSQIVPGRSRFSFGNFVVPQGSAVTLHPRAPVLGPVWVEGQPFMTEHY